MKKVFEIPTYLQYISIPFNEIDEIKIPLGSNLLTIDIAWNKLTKQPCIENASNLTSLSINNNLINNIDFSYNKQLRYINISNNPNLNTCLLPETETLTEIDLSNSPLINHIDISGCPKLKKLNLKNTNITELDISENVFLEDLKLPNKNIKILITTKHQTNENLKHILQPTNNIIVKDLQFKAKNKKTTTKIS